MNQIDDVFATVTAPDGGITAYGVGDASPLKYHGKATFLDPGDGQLKLCWKQKPTPKPR